ncbi:hypothetical protein ACWD00_27540 [Streptomyces viridiviolaceus]
MTWGDQRYARLGLISTMQTLAMAMCFVGTALTTQTVLGFLLTVVTINLVPVRADLTDWRYAFLALAPGPLLGALAMRALGYRAQTTARQHQLTGEST